jgi:CDK-activating kinase assembly factor MAT1
LADCTFASCSFNKRIEDFSGDLRKFNDYLEEVETIMFNLIYDLDDAQTQEKIEQYRQENKDLIAMNAMKQINEDKAIAFKIDKEIKEKQLRKEAFQNQSVEDAIAKQMEGQELINKLVFLADVGNKR